MKFQDDISNMNTYIHTDKPKPICPPLFQSWGHKNYFLFFGGGGVGRGVGFGGDQGGCERRIEVFGKIHKKKSGGGGGGGGGGVVAEGVRWGGPVGGGGVRMDANAMLGIGGDVGYGDVNQE